ncbi:hypothetical protein GCM10009817_02360 [Terrabacter lapilli]|uniref:Uncharacterized protein n=1 Tax=Terrabacter lapilli TaxID=436231 RepID=A0ABN2RAZ3_9MICO
MSRTVVACADDESAQALKRLNPAKRVGGSGALRPRSAAVHGDVQACTRAAASTDVGTPSSLIINRGDDLPNRQDAHAMRGCQGRRRETGGDDAGRDMGRWSRHRLKCQDDENPV